MGKIFVVGVGPGSNEFLTPAAADAVEKADFLLGGKDALSMFDGKKPMKLIDKNLDEALEFIKKHREKNVAVLTSGDPCFYSILNLILKTFSKDEVEVIPGVSSIQAAFARIKEPWHDARFVSLHGRDMEKIIGVINAGKIVALTGGGISPSDVAKFLIEHRAENRKVVVCENISRSSERVVETDLLGAVEKKFSGNCVMIIYRDAQDAKWNFRTPGIPDEYFVRRSSPMTKEEVRALTLSKARIKEDSVVYDIGAGSGSISVEAAILAERGKVFAVEEKAERVEVIEKNIMNFRLGNVEIIHGTAPKALENLPVADRIIIGGSGGRLKEILFTCISKLMEGGIIVINAIKDETRSTAVSMLDSAGFDLEVTKIEVSRLQKSGTMKLNPVFIISAMR